MLTLVHGEVGSTDVPCRLDAPTGDLCAARQIGPLRVPFGDGQVQLVARGADLVLDITARHFDTAGCPRREHAYGTLTRVETQRLIVALVSFLASTPGTREAA
jgi:hypothetical protein